jgi:hypothetical protein
MKSAFQRSLRRSMTVGSGIQEKANQINVPMLASNAFQRLGATLPYTPLAHPRVARGLEGRLPLARFAPLQVIVAARRTLYGFAGATGSGATGSGVPPTAVHAARTQTLWCGNEGQRPVSLERRKQRTAEKGERKRGTGVRLVDRYLATKRTGTWQLNVRVPGKSAPRFS